MTVIEFTGKHVGALFGLLNSLGAVGATSSQLFMGYEDIPASLHKLVAAGASFVTFAILNE